MTPVVNVDGRDPTDQSAGELHFADDLQRGMGTMKSELHVIRLVLGVFLSLLAKSVFAQELGPRPATPMRHVEMISTEVRELTSANDGQEYKLLISLPPGYHDPGKAFGVVYVLDGQWDFLLVSSLVPGQLEDGFLPPLIVVGITWGGQNPNYDVLRQRDFTPTKGRLPQTGNAPNFLSFIKTQLVPFIDANYRTRKDDRAIYGHVVRRVVRSVRSLPRTHAVQSLYYDQSELEL